MATIFDLSRDDFFFALDELGLPPEQRDELIRQYRSQNSLFAPLNRAADERQAAIADEGRRPVAGGLLSKPEGAAGMDALRGLRLEPMSGLLGMLTGAGRAVEAPAAAAQGLIPAGDMAGEALGTAGLASLGGAALTRPVGSVGMGGRIADGLPEPRNAAERAARDILDLRAAGRASEVTDEMRARADPQYMFDNTPLPMDEASRLERRDTMYGKDRYHGSNMDFPAFGRNVFTSDNPTVASTYNRGMLDAQIYPVVTREGPLGTVNVEGGLSNWNMLSPDMIDDPYIARELDMGMPISTRDIERQAVLEGRSGVTFRDINDLGPGFNSQQFKNLGYTPEQEEALRLQYLSELSVPSEVDVRLSPNLVRSRFALFDPEFAHLSNLNAANASPLLGLFAMMAAEEQRNGQ